MKRYIKIRSKMCNAGANPSEWGFYSTSQLAPYILQIKNKLSEDTNKALYYELLEVKDKDLTIVCKSYSKDIIDAFYYAIMDIGKEKYEYKISRFNTYW